MMYIKSFIEKDDFSVSDAGGLEKTWVLPIGVKLMTLLATSPDALPLS